MKSVEQIIEYINRQYEVGTERPVGYFRNLESMEDQLSAFESLYEFIVDDSRHGPAYPSAFVRFLHDEGYGALGYSRGKWDPDTGKFDVETSNQGPLRAPSADEVARMKEFGEFWRKYLSSGRRLARTAADREQPPSP